MRPRFLFFAVLVVLAFSALVFWLRPSKPGAISSTLPVVAQHDVTMNRSNAVAENVSGHPAVQESTQQRPNTAITTEEKNLQSIQEANDKSDAPVEFYGQVLDQNGNAVAGAKFNVSVIQSHLFPANANGDYPLSNNVVKVQKETGADGRFTVSDMRGGGLDMELVPLNGYEISAKYSRSFGNKSGSYENPIIFRMWKLGEKETLVTRSQIYEILPGKVYCLNLITGEKSEGAAEGDLRVSISRPDGVKRRQKYAWSFSIDAIGGGLVETDDEFMYLAPESGYTPVFGMQLDPAASIWQGQVARQFYIRTRDGKVYGRIHVIVHSIYDVQSAMEIDSAINANGSRNLQP